MSFLDTFCEMIVILAAMAVGFLANRLEILGGNADAKLSKLILNITLPAMTIGSVASGSSLPEIREILSVLRIAVIFYGLELVFVLLVPRLLKGKKGEQGVWKFVLMFPNVGFVGFPVAVALFGQEALFYAVILTLPFGVLSSMLAPVFLGSTGKFRWKLLATPCVIAAVIALILSLTKIPLPPIVGETFSFIGNITVPLSLLVVGSLLASLPAKQIFTSFRLWILAALRLLALPLLFWLIVSRMDFAPLVRNVALVQMAMPVATNGSMFCMEYGGDKEAMAQTTLLTTAASILTIPLIAAAFF